MTGTTFALSGKGPLRVLVVEDSDADAELCLWELRKAGYKLSADRVETQEAFLERLHAQPYDVILSDYSLPLWNGLDALDCLQQVGKDIPLILVTGVVGDEKAVECIQRGGADFVLKGRLARLPFAVEKAIREKTSRAEQRALEQEIRSRTAELVRTNEILVGQTEEKERATEALRKANEQLEQREAFTRGVIDSSAAHLAVLNRAGEIVEVNKAWRDFACSNSDGRPLRTDLGVNYLDVCRTASGRCADEAPRVLAGLQAVLNGLDDKFQQEYPCHSPNKERWFLMWAVPLHRPEGGLVVSHIDITERKLAELEKDKLQARLQQAEAQYRVLFEESADATWLMDKKGILACNAAALKLFGYASVDLMRHPAEISPPHQPGGTPSLTAAEQRMATAFRNGTERFEWLHQRRDGTVFPAEVCLTSLTICGQPQLLATVRDITERKRTEEALVQERNLLRTLIDNLPHYIYAKDTKNRFLLANDALARRVGAASARELLGKSDLDFYPPEVAAKYAQDEQQIMQSGQPVIDREDSTIDATNGQIVWHTTTEIPLRGKGGNVIGLLGIGHDITERKRAEDALRYSEATNRVTFEQAAMGIAHVAPDGKWLRVNGKLCAILGSTPEELLQTTFQEFTHPDDLSDDLDRTRQLLAGEIDSISAEKRYIRKDQSTVWVKLCVSLVRRSSGEPQHFISIIEDITARKRAEEQIQFLAYNDALTGLPNRRLLEDRLTGAFAAARRRNERVAVLFLDLDRFKLFNDSFGHAGGDLLLQTVATRIKRWARDQDTVARWSGDEFVIVLNGINEIGDAAIAADRLLTAITTDEIAIETHLVNIGCSIGISVFPDHGMDHETLIRKADAAMYRAKANGRNSLEFFTEDMNDQALERLTLEHSLRTALERKEFFLAYQPQMDIVSGRLIGLEALLRWQHPEMGLVPPDKFIRIAENSGLIISIGEWVLRTACTQMQSWHTEGLLAVPVAVNVSAIQFRREGLCKLIGTVLRETGLAPHHLELELTESLLLSNANTVLSTLGELTGMGVKLAIDDFGTGYSSLSYLKQFRVDKLKIDRSFIKNVTVNQDDAAITATIISMAKNLRLKVIAEGVETKEQLSFLRTHQCDEIQGYYFCKPLAADELAAKLRSHGLGQSQVAAS